MTGATRIPEKESTGNLFLWDNVVGNLLRDSKKKIHHFLTVEIFQKNFALHNLEAIQILIPMRVSRTETAL